MDLSSGYNLVLAIWGAVWVIGGTGLIYYMVRAIAQLDRAETADYQIETPAAPAPTPVAAPRRELVLTGR
jgi:hypothetical protein